MKIRTKVNAGGIGLGNHNENLVRDRANAVARFCRIYKRKNRRQIARVRSRFNRSQDPARHRNRDQVVAATPSGMPARGRHSAHQAVH